MNNRIKSLIIIGFTLVLSGLVILFAGCAAKEEEVVDTTPPEVLSVTPLNGAANVEPNVVVTVNLSEALDPATISESTVVVTVNGLPITQLDIEPVSFTLSQDGLTATYQHPGGLALIATYEITLTTGIKDLAGNSLAADYTWSFTTRDGIWSSDAYTVSTEDGLAKNTPQVAFDAPGKANVIWSDADDTQGSQYYSYYSVKYNRYDAFEESPWTNSDFVSSAIGESQYNNTEPQIASTMQGTSFIVWRGGSDSYTYTYGSRFINDAWETDTSLPENSDYSNEGSYAPHIAVDASGNASAVWENSVNDIFYGYYDYILTSRFDNSTEAWSTPELISWEGNYAFDPDVASSGNGDMVAVWLQDDGTESIFVYASLYDADDDPPSWTSGVLISESELSYGGNYLRVAMDSAGNAIAVWDDFGIYANRYDAVSGWLGKKEISSYGSDPQVVFDPFGNAIIVWEEMPASVYATRYEAVTDWTSWDPLVLEQELSSVSGAGSPRLAIDGVGNAVVVWQQYVDPNYEIGFNRYRFGSTDFTWEYDGGSVLYSSDVYLYDLAVGIGSSGKAIAAWVRYTSAPEYLFTVETKVFE